jgi:hypothetical protein
MNNYVQTLVVNRSSHTESQVYEETLIKQKKKVRFRDWLMIQISQPVPILWQSRL